MTVFKRLVVGVDGSADSGRALDLAVTLAECFGAEVVAVHAVGLLAHLGSGPPVPSQSHIDELRNTFESDWCAGLRSSGITHRMLLLDGPPALKLLEAADSEHADMIVVGSRGSGATAGLRLGSTSHRVVEHSRCPVLVVPPEHADL